MSALSSYRQLFSLPGASRFFPLAALARLGVAMQSLAILWAIHGASGSFAIAGVATGPFAAAEAFLSPQIARFIDSHGQATVAMAQLPAFALASLTLLIGTWVPTPTWVWIAASGLAGASCPQIGSLAAARWRHITQGSASMAPALALETAVNELTHMLGPVLVTTLSATVHSSLGLLISGALVIIFTCALVARRDSEPPTRPRGPGLMLDTRLVRLQFLPFVMLHLLLGAYFGGMTICLTSAAQSLGVGEFAGVMASVGGLASLLAGLAYGAVSRKVGATPVMLVAAAVLCTSCFGLSVNSGLIFLAALTAACSACIAPIVVPAAVKLQEVTPTALYVQAVTWTGSASALGTAAAAPVIGRLVDHGSAQTGYLAISSALVLLWLTCLWLTRVRRAPLAGRSAEHVTNG